MGQKQSAIAPNAPSECLAALTAISVLPNIDQLRLQLPELIRPLVRTDLVALVLRDEQSNRFVLCGDRDTNESDCLRCVDPGDNDNHDVPSTETLSVSELELRMSRIGSYIRKQGMQSSCITPLAIFDRQYGVLLLCRIQPGDIFDSQFSVIQNIATHVAIVLERVIIAKETCAAQDQLRHDNQRLLMMQRVSEAIVSELDLRKLIYKVSESLKAILKIEYSDLLLCDETKRVMKRVAVSFRGKGLMEEDYEEPFCNSPSHVAFFRREIVCDDAALTAERAKEVPALQFLVAEGLRSGCSIPLITQGRALGVLSALSTDESRFTPDCVSLLAEIAKPIAIAVDNALAYRKISDLKDKLTCEKKYLEGEVSFNHRLDEIIGESLALKTALEQVETVADSDANVLILGETGTGKELIARAVHALSDRRDHTFIKLNCAAIPSGLLESELFGHEKGAFTGALAAKIGLVELADKGTLFLDEVGDIPLDLQPKLLRVLQERQLSRVGSTRTTSVDFRLVAATNRDLEKMVSEGQFRADLYYRLNVFPITIPPLRERREDIPLLVRHFTQKYARLRKRKIESIPTEAMHTLERWEWPGNVRELENIIERAVILSKGSVLNVPLKDLRCSGDSTVLAATRNSRRTSHQITKETILSALRESGGVVAGPRGAAVRLGLKRTTLLWKMHSMGISAKQAPR